MVWNNMFTFVDFTGRSTRPDSYRNVVAVYDDMEDLEISNHSTRLLRLCFKPAGRVDHFIAWAH
jgi:hypothetical protein